MSTLKRDMQTVANASTRGFRPMPEHPGIKALRRILTSMRDNDQGGYTSYNGDGEWSFISTGLPQTTPEELNALFDLVGVKPDAIKSKGTCTDCKFAKPCERKTSAGTFITYHGGGWTQPCVSCKGPSMSNFVKRRSTPKNFRHWCDWCGNIFESEGDRNEHWRMRKASGKGTCPNTGLVVLREKER